MTVTDQLKIIDNKIKANQGQYDLDRLAAKISAYSSGDLRKYEYLTGENLGYKPSVIEQTKFDYSPLGKVFTKEWDDKDDQKEGFLKRLKNIEKNQNSNNNDKNNNDKSKPSSTRSESSFYFTSSSSARSESGKKTSISDDDELERSVYFLDVANMKGINILEPKNKTETSIEYLKNNTEEFFFWLSRYF